MIKDTSHTAFINEVQPTISARQIRVLEVFENGGNFTNSELAARMQWSINRITGRVKELRDKGILEDAGKRECNETHREVHAWRLKSPQIGVLATEMSIAPTFNQYPSKSSRRDAHTVIQRDWTATCTCKGFYFRKTCSHVEKATIKNAEELSVLQPLF